MREPARPALSRALRVLAAVPVVTGLVTVLTGSATLPDAGDPTASVESELRFYATWWIAAGLFLWWLAPQVLERGTELRIFCALLFAGGCSRLLAAAAEGWPSQGQIGLLVVELTLPAVLVAWQARSRRAHGVDGREGLAEL